MEDNNKQNSPGANTLAHEQVAKEEDNIGIFFAAFAIQHLLTKDMLSMRQANPYYIKTYESFSMFASQRVIIRKILDNRSYKNIIGEIEAILLEYNTNQDKLPHDIYLSRINKAFLIRQIYSYTDQTLTKFDFVNNYVEKDIVHLDFDELYKSMWNFPVEQQIMILSRIFTQMQDVFETKKKSIKDSFVENIKRIKNDFASKNKKDTIEYKNLEMLSSKFDH